MNHEEQRLLYVYMWKKKKFTKGNAIQQMTFPVILDIIRGAW